MFTLQEPCANTELGENGVSGTRKGFFADVVGPALQPPAKSGFDRGSRNAESVYSCKYINTPSKPKVGGPKYSFMKSMLWHVPKRT